MGSSTLLVPRTALGMQVAMDIGLCKRTPRPAIMPDVSTNHLDLPVLVNTHTLGSVSWSGGNTKTGNRVQTERYRAPPAYSSHVNDDYDSYLAFIVILAVSHLRNLRKDSVAEAYTTYTSIRSLPHISCRTFNLLS